ncbi:inositol monophosphatase family protein [Paenibacillus thermoaerophilus]|uniref:Inositol-1-monophosphatase n=1 Tax=Paenibacillus thermoaerophilus TaxID=1215385 RepID=A0ABW2V1V2_9BACL|nr:inositol monophosphatase family protein [Paenibacillus thermoaerophilus]TMV13921.1 inositol monophosphatase [Paenibacillus thermoaerophilus]
MSGPTKPLYTVSGKSFTAVAISTAAKAGEWIQTRLGQFSKLEMKSSSRDLVTEVDKGAETMIRNLIRTHFPQHAFLGEEGVGGDEEDLLTPERAEQAEYVWIVDPVDGTTNFVHGLPFFSVSIALAHRGEVIVGVVYDPVRDELFVAEKGKGAYVRGKRARVSEEATLADSLLATGFPADTDRNLPINLLGIRHLATRSRNIRTIGSAALHLAYVSAGRLSGFWELGLNAWDVAAGALLVQEAGGRVTDTAGRPYRLTTRHIAASNGAIHDELVSELRAANATGYEPPSGGQ